MAKKIGRKLLDFHFFGGKKKTADFWIFGKKDNERKKKKSATPKLFFKKKTEKNIPRRLRRLGILFIYSAPAASPFFFFYRALGAVEAWVGPQADAKGHRQTRYTCVLG